MNKYRSVNKLYSHELGLDCINKSETAWSLSSESTPPLQGSAALSWCVPPSAPPPDPAPGPPVDRQLAGLGRRLLAALSRGSRNTGAGALIPVMPDLPQQAGSPGTAPRGSLTPTAGDLGEPFLGLDLAHALRGGNRVSVAYGALLPFGH